MRKYLFGNCLQLFFGEDIVPDAFHVIPVAYNAVFHWISYRQQASVFLTKPTHFTTYSAICPGLKYKINQEQISNWHINDVVLTSFSLILYM